MLLQKNSKYNRIAQQMLKLANDDEEEKSIWDENDEDPFGGSSFDDNSSSDNTTFNDDNSFDDNSSNENTSFDDSTSSNENTSFDDNTTFNSFTEEENSNDFNDESSSKKDTDIWSMNTDDDPFDNAPSFEEESSENTNAKVSFDSFEDFSDKSDNTSREFNWGDDYASEQKQELSKSISPVPNIPQPAALKSDAVLEPWTDSIDTKQQLIHAVHYIYKNNLETLPKHTENFLTQNIDNYLTNFIKNECYSVLLKEQQENLAKAKYKSVHDQIKEYILGYMSDKQIHNIFISLFQHMFHSDYHALFNKCKNFIEKIYTSYAKQVKSFFDTHLWSKRTNAKPKPAKIRRYKLQFGEEYDLTTPEGRQKIYKRLQQERDKWQLRLQDLEMKERQGKLSEEYLQNIYKQYDEEYDKSIVEDEVKEPEPEKVPFTERRKRGRPPKKKNNNTTQTNISPSIAQPTKQENKSNVDNWDTFSEDNFNSYTFASKNNRILKRIILSQHLYKYALSQSNIDLYINKIIQSNDYKKLESFCLNRYAGNANLLINNAMNKLTKNNLTSWLNLFLQKRDIVTKFKDGLQNIINEYLNNNSQVIKLLPNINNLSGLIKNLKADMLANAVDKGPNNVILRESCKDYFKPIILEVFKEIAPAFIEEAVEEQEAYTQRTLNELSGNY